MQGGSSGVRNYLETCPELSIEQKDTLQEIELGQSSIQLWTEARAQGERYVPATELQKPVKVTVSDRGPL